MSINYIGLEHRQCDKDSGWTELRVGDKGTTIYAIGTDYEMWSKDLITWSVACNLKFLNLINSKIL